MSYLSEVKKAAMYNLSNETSFYSMAIVGVRARPCFVEAADMKYKTHLSAIFAISIVIIALSPVAVVGNALILTAIWKKTFERTWFHVLLSGLALSDLFIGLVVQPFTGTGLLLLVSGVCELGAQKAQTLFLVVIVGFVSGAYLCAVELMLITLLSIERWLQVTRLSLVTPLSRCLIIAVILIAPAPVPVSYVVQYTWFGTQNKVLRIFVALFIFLCYLITFFSYFKVYQIIRQHQQQVQRNQSSQNFGRPAINLAKYKRSVISILCIFTLFSLTLFPMGLTLAYLNSRNDFSCLEGFLVHYVAITISFLSPCLNPALYVWRMNDIRNQVKSLFCTN